MLHNKLVPMLGALALGQMMLVAPQYAALAGDFPSAPVQVTVAYGPGGATDFQARIVTMMAGK